MAYANQQHHVSPSTNSHRALTEAQAQPLYERIPVMLCTIDHQEQIVRVNEHWLQVLGYTRTDVLGRCSADFYTQTSRQLVQTIYLPEFFQKGQLQDVELQFLKKNGEVLDLLVSATAERDAAGEIVGALLVLRDITRPNRAEQMLRIVAEGTAATTGGDFFRSLVSHLAQAFGVMYSMVTECTDHSMTRLRTLACYKYDNFIEQFEYDLAGGPCEGVIQDGLRVYPRLQEYFPKEDQQAYLGVAIYDSQGDVIGHLVVEDDKPWYPGPYDIDVLKLFAARAGAELERRRTEQALIESERRLRLLNERLADTNRGLEQMVAERTREIEQRQRVAESLRDMVMILNSERPLAEILDYIIAAATRLLGTDSGALFILQPDKKTLAVQTTCGLPAEYARNLTLPLNRSFLGQALVRGKPQIVTNLADALVKSNIPLDDSMRALMSAHYQTLLAVPLTRQNFSSPLEDVYGGIALYFRGQRRFADEEIELMTAFGAQAALAIENARLRQQAAMGAIMEERARLARELHDSVTQSLYSLTLLAEGWRRMARAGRLEQAEEALGELGELGQQALKVMRLLVYELRPPALEQEGLIGALHQRLAAVEKRSGVDARLVTEETVELPAQIEAGLYRIAQEALNNTLKHAAATAVTIELHSTTDQAILAVCDNGQGFDPAQLPDDGGLGLTSMRERVTQMGGELTLCSAPGQGTQVRIVIPFR